MATPKMRGVRVHDRTWDAAKAKAASEGRTLSDALNEFLEQYGETGRERLERRAPAPSDVA